MLAPFVLLGPLSELLLVAWSASQGIQHLPTAILDWDQSVASRTLISAVAYSTFAYFDGGHSRGLAMLISGGPYFLIGALFLASWWCSRKAGPRNESGA